MPKISVIVPTYQSEDTIGPCLDSLFAQTVQDFEVIVVNDGSRDRTREVLKTYESRIRVIDQENKGSNPARNRGWKEATGEYLLFLDSDIRMQPYMLERMLHVLQDHEKASYAYSSFRYGTKQFRLWTYDAERLQYMPYIPTTSLIRAKDFPGFDEKVARLQDWDLWLTMLRQEKTGVWIPEILFTVTPRKYGISRWAPRWLFWIPWHWVGWRPERVRSYKKAVAVIKKKHKLPE